MKPFIAILFFICCVGFANAQTDSITINFKNAYAIINDMLTGQEPLSFKKAVFVSENAYYNNTLSYEKFNAYIQYLIKIAEAYRKANPLKNYIMPTASKFPKAVLHLK